MKNTKMNNIENFEDKLNLSFEDKNCLVQALTHRSYLNEHKEYKAHNERLEFLGDAVLELIVSDYLFSQYPDKAEGELTSFRSALVKTSSLAETAQEIGIGDNILLSKGEEDTGGRTKHYLLANAFEAIVGAIYIDQGYEKSRDFVYEHLIKKLEHIIENNLNIDSKTKIQEIAQAKYKTTPTYDVIREEGPDHSKEFTVVVKIGDRVIGEGVGSSKQRAQEDAASKSIAFLLKETL